MVNNLFLNKVIQRISETKSIDEWVRATGVNMLLPFYHGVCDEVPEHLQAIGTYRSICTFKEDLEWLTKYFEPVDLATFLDRKKSGVSKKCFHLSFDDGLRSCYDVVAPILETLSIPATFFVNSGFVDNKELFYRYKASIIALRFPLLAQEVLAISYENRENLDVIAEENGVDFSQYLETNVPYMTSSQVEELLQRGFSIGAHSVDHPRMNEIILDKQINQVKESLNFVKGNFGVDKKFFAFPFTDDGVSKELFDRIEVDATFGTAGIKLDQIPNHYQRVSMETTHNAEKRVRDEMAYYWLRRMIGKHVVKR